MRWTLPVLCSLFIAVVGCSSGPSPEPGTGDETSEQQLWRTAELDSYSFDFQQQCFCVVEQVQPVTIEVRNGRVARVVARETGEEVPVDGNLHWPTIPELFTLVAEARAEGVEPLVVRHDPDLGYPTHVEIGSLAADAGVVYNASNVQPIQ